MTSIFSSNIDRVPAKAGKEKWVIYNKGEVSLVLTRNTTLLAPYYLNSNYQGSFQSRIILSIVLKTPTCSRARKISSIGIWGISYHTTPTLGTIYIKGSDNRPQIGYFDEVVPDFCHFNLGEFLTFQPEEWIKWRLMVGYDGIEQGNKKIQQYQKMIKKIEDKLVNANYVVNIL